MAQRIARRRGQDPIKVRLAGAHSNEMDGSAFRDRPDAMSASDAIDEFDRLYDCWFRDVIRWPELSAHRRPRSKIRAQEVFIVVRRKMSGFNGDNPAGWLYGNRLAHRERSATSCVVSPARVASS